MAFITKNLLLGLGIGIAAGAFGAKYYAEHKDDIDSKLRSIKGAVPGAAADGEMTLEELEAQKERLEDLIAEVKARGEQQ